MPGARFLETERLTLRTIEEEDVDFVHEHKNPPEVHRSYIWPYPENRGDVEEYLFEGDDGTSLLVCREGDDGEPEPVGEVGMHVDDRTREAEIGVWVAEPYWGEGYGTEACERFVDYAFAERNVHRMMAKHIEDNGGSKRIWEKLGFEHEGVHRESEFMDGAYRDMHVYGVLAEEWRERDE